MKINWIRLKLKWCCSRSFCSGASPRKVLPIARCSRVGSAALKEFTRLENKTTEIFNIMFQLRQRALRSGKQGYSDRGWPTVFCVFELEESVCLCVWHYEKLRESNKTSCCFRQSSVRDTCSGRLTKCP